MKTQALFASITLALAGSAFAAGDKHDHKPLHGGVVVGVKDMDYELVAKPTVIQLHLRDHGKAADLSKATAKLTLLTGTAFALLTGAAVAAPAVGLTGDKTLVMFDTETLAVSGTMDVTGVDRLHGIEMFANEIRMVPLEPVEPSQPCAHQRG